MGNIMLCQSMHYARAGPALADRPHQAHTGNGFASDGLRHSAWPGGCARIGRVAAAPRMVVPCWADEAAGDIRADLWSWAAAHLSCCRPLGPNLPHLDRVVGELAPATSPATCHLRARDAQFVARVVALSGSGGRGADPVGSKAPGRTP